MNFLKWLLFVHTSVGLSFSSFCFAQDFQKQKIKLGKIYLIVEVAKTERELAKGLMFRKSLKSNAGMLFIYNREEVLHFWMKNTFIPLSIGFFNKKRVLIDIQDMTPIKSEVQLQIPTYQSSGPAMYALEVPRGWFQRNKVKVGQKLELEVGTR